MQSVKHTASAVSSASVLHYHHLHFARNQCAYRELAIRFAQELNDDVLDCRCCEELVYVAEVMKHAVTKMKLVCRKEYRCAMITVKVQMQSTLKNRSRCSQTSTVGYWRLAQAEPKHFRVGGLLWHFAAVAICLTL